MMHKVNDTGAGPGKKPLGEFDKGRLDKVLAILAKLKVRFPKTEVVKRTGYKKGHVSSILNGNIPMSTNFFETFLEKFPDCEELNTVTPKTPINMDKEAKVEFEQSTLDLLAINKIYADAHKVFADAHKVFADAHREAVQTNKTLANVLERQRITVDEIQEIQQDEYSKLSVLETVVQGLGVKAGYWSTAKQASDELNKLYASALRKENVTHNQSGSGK